MKKVFRNSSKLECIFTEEGITFYGAEQEVYFPYGCIDSIKMSFMGVLQATCHTKICCFAVDRADKSAMKEMVKFAKEAMVSAPKAEPQVIDLTHKSEAETVPADLPPEEQLKRYKALFIQGILSKEEYDAKKRQLS